MIDIALPHNGWLPRPHQIKLWRHLQTGGKRALAVWHRRAGKDEICLHHTACSAWTRAGNYWHCLPEYNQARKAIWTAVNPHTGRRRIDEAFPHVMRESTNDQEMFLRFKNGSTFQLIGSDRYDSTVGAGAAGIVFSEWALANPSAWGYFRPMVEENAGWAAFITTPRGRNHAHALYKHATSSPDWFCELLTARDTNALTTTQLEEALLEYQALYGEDVGTAQFRQEYLCDWNAAILGAFYALEMARVRNEGRILEITALEGEPVHRAWDLGMKDDTSIWWFQPVGGQLFILDHYAASGAGVEHFRDVIEQKHRQHGWKHGNDHVPHDAKIKEWGTGLTRVETMQTLGLNPILVPMASLEDGRNAVRRTLPLCVFHPRTELGGIDALEQYRREWDDEKKAFRANAVHDWCFTGDTEVLTRYGACRMMDLPQTGEVLTPCGWKRYHSPRVTRRDARLVEVRFTDGLTVRCTPDHLFETASGWLSSERLTSSIPIRSCLTRSRNISMAVFIGFSRARRIIRGVAESFTGRLGWRHLERFHPGATFTTGMVTCVTTGLPIWSAFQAPSIGRRFGKRDRLAEICRHIFYPRRDWRQQIGTSPKPGGFGTSAMLSGRRDGSNGNASHWHADRVARFLRHWFARVGALKSIAARIAGSRGLAVTSVRPLAERADVWCLSVPEAESFALSNGAVVHNCSHPSDAFRYLSLSWHKPPLRKIKTPPQLSSGWQIPPPREPQRGGIVL